VKVAKILDWQAPIIDADESRRKNVIDAALDLTEELVTGRIEFFRSVVRSAGQAVGGKQS
jgi:hypothetical protein